MPADPLEWKRRALCDRVTAARGSFERQPDHADAGLPTRARSSESRASDSTSMNNDEASYADLIRRIPAGSQHYERAAASGATYQLELQFFWDNQPGGNVRVMGSIDDGGWRAVVPLSRSFI